MLYQLYQAFKYYSALNPTQLLSDCFLNAILEYIDWAVRMILRGNSLGDSC